MKRRYSKSADGLSTNDLTDAKIEEVLAAFTDFVDRRCSNGAYSPETGTPDAFFFRNAKSEAKGPFDWFASEVDKSFGNGDHTKFTNILYKVGLNSSVPSANSDDEADIIDRYEVDVERKEHPINFIGVCSRINRASVLLFEHNNTGYASYDIFSFHRAQTLSPKEKEFRTKVSLAGITVTFEDYENSDAITSSETIGLKMRHRIKLCPVFEDVLKNGIRKEEVFSKLFQNVKNVTCETPDKNGARLFSFEGINTKHKETNGQMLQILLDGYLALKDLLEFLSSASNKTSVTMNSMPVDIFRYPDRLRRVHTFEEYVNYNGDIKPLCTAVNEDYSRKKPDLNGIMSNDTVYDILSQEKLLKSDLVMQSLRSMPISYIGTAVSKMRGNDLDAKLKKDINHVHSSWYNLVKPNLEDPELKKFKQACEDRDIATLEKFSVSYSKKLLGLNTEMSKSIYGFSCAAVFAWMMEQLMILEENPVTDDDENYQFYSEDMLSDFQINGEFEERLGGETISGILVLRFKAIKKCMNIFWGAGLDENSMQSPSWEEYRSFWCVAGSVYQFFTMYWELIDTMESVSQDDLCLLFAIAAGKETSLRLSRTVVNTDNLAFLNNHKNSAIKYRAKMYLPSELEAREYVAAEQKREQKLLTTFQRLFANLSETFDVFETVQSRVDSAYQFLGDPVSYDSDLEEALMKTSQSIATMAIDPNLVKISRTLEGVLNFDHLEFAMFNGSRYCYRRKEDNKSVYIHRYGYKVVYSSIIKSCDVIKMEADDVRDILYRIEVNGR
jgi:hypothetical protein